jgi:hypothetical protein
MRNILLAIFMFALFASLQVLAQVKDKPPIDAEAIRHWGERDTSCTVSDNGKYGIYTFPGGVMVKGLFSAYKEMLPAGATDARFSPDSKLVIYKQNDAIILHKIGGKDISLTGKDPEVLPSGFLLYKNGEGLVLRNLRTGKENAYPGVDNYTAGKAALVLQGGQKLIWVKLPSVKATTLSSTVPISNIVFNRNSTAFAATNDSAHALYYYEPGMSAVKTLYQAADLAGDMPKFSKDGQRVFFVKVEKREEKKLAEDKVKVDVWNYKDRNSDLPSVHNMPPKERFLFVIDVRTKQVVSLETTDDNALYGSDNPYIGDYLVSEQAYRRGEFYWRKDSWESLYLISTKDGSRKGIVEKKPSYINTAYISPNERFVVWFSDADHHYFCYEIATGITRNISVNIPYPVYNKDADILSDRTPYDLAGWVAGDAAILLYDRSDIWQVDPTGARLPICVTAGYGRAHDIIFRRAVDVNNIASITNNSKLILTALDKNTLNNGFWTAKTGQSKNPIMCTMGPYMFCFQDLYDGTTGMFAGGGAIPQYLQSANLYIVRRENVREGSITFLTQDFKNYREILHNRPHASYNWLSSELIKWRLPNGQMAKGILYKPENFDSTKQYPLIFKYYERRSGELNIYLRPSFAAAELDIPTFVSNGYLICVPDIYYTPGNPCVGIVDAVTSAAHYLSHYNWVDSTKLGIQGHSFGGYETNCLVAHTNIFAAACEAAGPSNFVSGYSELLGTEFNGHNREIVYERGQSNMIVPLFEDNKRYIDNSPVFGIANITTPLLIMHNKEDASVSFAQGLEMFLGMRRAGKKAWMLQYDGNGHILNGKAAEDFTIRMQQFFDHYLKGAPAPIWMTQGIPPSERGIEDGLAPDNSGATP